VGNDNRGRSEWERTQALETVTRAAIDWRRAVGEGHHPRISTAAEDLFCAVIGYVTKYGVPSPVELENGVLAVGRQVMKMGGHDGG
jgi:hypothetical protein